MVLGFCFHEFELEQLKYRHQCMAGFLRSLATGPKESGYRTKGKEFLVSLDLASDQGGS